MSNVSCALTNVTCFNGLNNGTNLTLTSTPEPMNVTKGMKGTGNTILVIATIGAPAVISILLALSIMTVVIYWKNRGRGYHQREDSYDFIKDISTPTYVNQNRGSRIESKPTTVNQMRDSRIQSPPITINQIRESRIESTPTTAHQIRDSHIEVSSTVVS